MNQSVPQLENKFEFCGELLAGASSVAIKDTIRIKLREADKELSTCILVRQDQKHLLFEVLKVDPQIYPDE